MLISGCNGCVVGRPIGDGVAQGCHLGSRGALGLVNTGNIDHSRVLGFQSGGGTSCTGGTGNLSVAGSYGGLHRLGRSHGTINRLNGRSGLGAGTINLSLGLASGDPV